MCTPSGEVSCAVVRLLGYLPLCVAQKDLNLASESTCSFGSDSSAILSIAYRNKRGGFVRLPTITGGKHLAYRQRN